MSVKLPKIDSYWYVATPYTNYCAGINNAYVGACSAVAYLIGYGHRNVYSPIAHCHAVAIHGGIDPLDWGLWMDVQEAMKKAAGGLLIVKMRGWEESKGIQQETEYFSQGTRPIAYMDWPE
jgi:hypothetical protein